jgi:hypothetical protein
VLIAAPVVSFGLLGASLVRPSHLARGGLPARAEPIAAYTALAREQRVYPAGTALEIAADARSLRVVASDGGGAGRLPLRSRAPLEALRVARVRDDYAIEVMQAGVRYVTRVDRAGVRQDDDLRARLLDRVPSWALYLMLASLFATAAALLPVLAGLSDVRRAYTREAGARLAPQALSEQRARTIRRAYLVALLLVPFSAYSLYWGAQSVLG